MYTAEDRDALRPAASSPADIKSVVDRILEKELRKVLDRNKPRQCFYNVRRHEYLVPENQLREDVSKIVWLRSNGMALAVPLAAPSATRLSSIFLLCQLSRASTESKFAKASETIRP